MMEKFCKIIRPLFIKLNRVIFINQCGKLYYRLGIRIFLYFVKRLPGIDSIYLRNSFAVGDWVPWESDIDVTVIIQKLDIEKEIIFLNRFWRIYRILNIPFPFIKHIDIFSLEEFKFDILYSEPQMDYLTKSLKLIYGREYRKKINCNPDSIFSFRIHDWMQFMEWLYKDNFNRRGNVRKYCRFFDKILHLANNNIQAENLRELLSIAESSNFSLQNSGQFVLKGFYYSMNIFDTMYKQLDNKQIILTRFCIVNIDEKYSSSFLENIKIFINSLWTVINYIRSIFIDPGSLENFQYRLWIILKNNIREDDFLNLIKLIKTNSSLLLKQGISLYIFTENTLNLFLITQRIWYFEYFHLKRHAQVVFGENILQRLNSTSDEVVIEKVYNCLIVCLNGLRALMNNSHTKIELASNLYKLLAWKLLIEKNIIAATRKEVIYAFNEYFDIKNIILLSEFIKGNYRSKKEIYIFLKSILNDLIERYCVLERINFQNHIFV